MVVPVDGEVVDEQLDAVLLGVGVDDGHVHVLDQHLHLAALPRLPQVAGDVEQDGLREGQKGKASIGAWFTICEL